MGGVREFKESRRIPGFLIGTSGSMMSPSTEESCRKSVLVWRLDIRKLNIQKTNCMASGPITSWQIHGETVETVTDFILGGSKITADGDCSHEIKRRLLLVFLVAQRSKRLPGMRETWVLSLGWEDPLEKEMANHSSVLSWKIPWTEEPCRLQSMGLLESDTT